MLVEIRGLPPFRQKKGERMGHGAFAGQFGAVPLMDALEAETGFAEGVADGDDVGCAARFAGHGFH